MHLTTVALQVLWSIIQKLIMWIVISRSILEHSTSIFHEELFVNNVSLYKANKSVASTISKLFPLINSAVILSLIKNADSRWREFIMHASMQKNCFCASPSALCKCFIFRSRWHWWKFELRAMHNESRRRDKLQSNYNCCFHSVLISNCGKWIKS